MNGYEVMADDLRKMVKSGRMTKEAAEPQIKMYEVAGSLSYDDMCILFDTGVFNDFLKSYINEIVKEAGLDEEVIDKIKSSTRCVLDTKTAKEITK